MNLEVLAKAININNKIKQLEKAKKLLGNYDAKITCSVGSHHNGNTKTFASVEIPIELIKNNENLKDVLSNEIQKLYTELDNL